MKNQLKKSLSLMLAVLMVLSCWVWVAPTKAEAADYKDGHYYVKVTTNVNDTGNEDNSTITITYKTNNGQGETKEFVKTYGRMGWDGNSTVFEEYIPGYPTGFKWVMNMGNGRSENHRDITLWIGKDKDHCTTKLFYETGYKFENPLIGDTKNTCQIGVVAGLESPRPDTDESFFYDNKGNVFTSDTLVTIPDTGDSTVISKDFNAQICDQYGVYWYNAPNFNLSKAAGGTTDTADEESGFWWVDKGTSGKSVTVKINEQMQKSLSLPLSNTDGYVDYYIVASLTENDGTAILSRKIRVTYPKYDWIFDTTVSGSAYTADKIIMQDGSFYDANNDSQPDAHFEKDDYLAYNQKASVYPVSAERKGFTFLGFWTQQQTPDVGQPGNPFSLESEFKYPISQANYDALTDEEKAGYVVAGEQWNSKDSAMLNTEGNKNYYAWWLSDDINVKFYDIDGKYLLEKTVKAGHRNTAFTWPTPTQQYVSGAFTYNNFKGIWEHTDGTEVNSQNHTFWNDLVLTPLYETVSFTNKYNIAFFNAYGANGMYGYTKEYTYRETASVPTISEMTEISETDAYTYTFEGFVNWKPENGNYHIMLEDVDFDEAGHALNLVEDFTVRDDVSYYPVYRRHVKNYDVYFEYINEQADYVGKYINFNYGDKITAPEGVPSVYASEGYEYTFLGWSKNGQDVINLSQETCLPDAEYYAVYSEGVPTPYTISFVYKNEKGEDVTTTTEVNHGDYISYEFVESLKDKPYGIYDDGESQLSFNLEKGKWNFNGTDYTYDDLVNFDPKGHTTFTAVYEDGIPFYTVTYKDGNNTESYRLLSGEKLPQWTYEVEGEEKTYLPAIPDTDEGRYTFIGWYDEEQVDIAAPNGNKYEAGVTPVTGNVTLYPQFKFGKFEYHIQFVNFDGTELISGTFNYLDSLGNIIREAKALAIKPADKTYTYQFIGWDKKVPEFCEGGEPNSTITFTAQYKPVYIYYNIDWLNDEAATTPLKTSKYIYGDRIFTPSVSLTAPEGKVFAGWFYKDAEGVEHAYNRNITVTGDMQFYAKYEVAPAVYTVKVVTGKGADDYSFTVKENTSLVNLVSDPVAGYIDSTYHDAFAGWYTTRNEVKDEETGEITYTYENLFNVKNDVVTGNITLYATYTKGTHVLNKSEVKEVPTYPMAAYTDYDGTEVPYNDGKGVKTVWCECNKELTKKDAEPIAALTDSKAPTGTGYIGTKWNTEDGDINDVVYASPKTSLILTTSDTGDVEATFNASGLGIGVQEIYAAIYPASRPITKDDITVTKGELVGDVQFAAAEGLWTKMYDWKQIQTSLIAYYGGWDKIPSVYQNYPGNATAEVGAYNVTDGETYKVYAVVIDKAGNWSFIETCSFKYDATAPVVTFTGDSNTEKNKFCGEVAINVEEVNAYTVKANGEELTADNGVYKITAPGYYNIVVEDVAGNKVSKYVTVTAGHDMQEYVVEATCEHNGLKTVKCSVCGWIDEAAAEEIETTGHKLETKHVAATCTEDGYDIITCAKCGITENNYYGENQELLYPANGHSYKMTTDAEGNEVAEVIVTLPATCMAEGKGYNLCTVCGYREVVILPIDADAHNPFPVKLVKSTCTQAGSRTQVCRYNSTHVLVNETLPLADHTYGWKVKTEAGCFEGVKAEDGTYTEAPAYGVEVEYCTKCGADHYDDEGNLVTRPIETLKKHFWVATKTNNADGSITISYNCANCTATKPSETIEPEKVITYKVEFIVGDAVTEFEVIRGASIAEDAIADPTKANSEDGKHKYTFAGWFTEGNEEYILGNAVYSDLKLYPKFTESNIIYEVQFVKVKSFKEVEVKDDEGNVIGTKIEYTYENPDVEEVTTLNGYKGAIRKPSADPVLKGNDKYSFKFLGWKDTAGKIVKDFTVKDSATYTASYEEIKNVYNVVFMNGTEPCYVIEGLTAGEDAVYNKVDAEGNIVYPTKASTAEKHYTFDGKWYTSADCKEEADLTDIQAKTVVYAGFIEEEHNFDEGTVTQEWVCGQEEIKKYVCETCGFYKTETTKPVKGHTKDGGTYDAATGENIYKCVDCGIELERTKASYTIKFFNDDGLAVDIVTVPANTEVEFDYGENNANVPTKKANAQYTYTFAGWKAPDGTEYKMGTELPKATADIVYTAYYTSTVRTYTVRFANVNKDVVYEVEGVAYGASVDSVDTEKKYTYTEKLYGKKDATADGHYVFSGWDTDITNIVGDTFVRPVFELESHEFDGGKATGATCTTPGGTKYTCACGYSYMGAETVPATGHNLKLIETIEPDFVEQKDGKRIYECQNPGCDYKKEEKINGKLAEIKVTVKDTAGNPVQGALVQLYKKADGLQVGGERTGSSGVVTFYVQPGDYTVTVKVDGVGDTNYDVSVDEDGNTTGNQEQVTVNKPAAEEEKCECSCHRNNFWGGFFRFFQKIIKLFTGKASCCADPDSRI